MLSVPLVAAAERNHTEIKTAPEALTVDAIVKRHVAALGGEAVLRRGTTFSFEVSGTKDGKKFTKTVYQAKPNKLRVDIVGDDGAFSKGFDGKVAWTKKGSEPSVRMTPDETKGMASHAAFEEPLLDYAKKGTRVKLVGKADRKGTETYDLEVTTKAGEVEHHFIDVASFLLVEKTWIGKDKDGKALPMLVRFGDYKQVQGRAVNHSVTWVDAGKETRSEVSAVVFDKPIDARLFSMPK